MLYWETFDPGMHPWHQDAEITMVAQQDNMCFHTTKTAKEQSDECDKKLKASTWLKKASDPNNTRDVPENA